MSTEISVDIAVDSRSIVGRQSVDSEIDYRPSIGRYFDDASRLTIGHMSVIYRSTVGGISVNCRWYIGLGEKSAKCRWTKSYIGRDTSGTTIDRVSTECRSTIDRLSTAISTDCRPSVDRVSTECRPSIDRLSTECRPSIDRLSTAISTAISTDISVDITHSKQDPKN